MGRIISAEDFLDTPIFTDPADMKMHIKQTTVSESRQNPVTTGITDKITLSVTATEMTFGSISESISNSLADTRFLIDAKNNKAHTTTALQFLTAYISCQISLYPAAFKRLPICLTAALPALHLWNAPTPAGICPVQLRWQHMDRAGSYGRLPANRP